MKVIIASTVIPIRGGVMTWVNSCAIKLNKLGIKTSVINSLGAKNDNFVLAPPKFVKIFYRLLNIDAVFYLAFLSTRILLKLRVLDELRKHDIKVIHAQDTNAFQAVYRLCKKRGIRLVLSLHGQFYKGGISSRKIDENTWLGRLLIKDERDAYRKASFVITVSQYTYDYVCQHTDKEKITIIRNFVDTDVFYPYKNDERKEIRKEYNYQEHDFVLSYVGRLAKAKGLQHLLKSVSMLKKSMSIKLMIVGSGPENKYLLQLTKELGLEGQVRFIGEVALDKLNHLYNTADVFVLPAVSGESSYDLTPMAILEAKASGVPVITTPVGGIKDLIIQGENGILVEERNEQSIAQAVELLYRDNELKQKIVDYSFSEINEEYSLNIVIHRILDIYQLDKAI